MVHYHLQPTHEDWEILAYPKALGAVQVALGVKVWVLGGVSGDCTCKVITGEI